MTTRARASAPRFASKRCMPATPTSYRRSTSLPIISAVTTASSATGMSLVPAAAGTSDIPVAEEAVVTAEIMGNEVERLYDVGVAGIHRLLANRGTLARARVVIGCAGMEGALPSVVGGLV